MLKALIKTAIWKYIITFIAGCISFLVLVKVEGMEPLLALRMFFGGVATSRPILLMIYITGIILLQYINLDTIIYYLKNRFYIVRFHEEKELLYKSIRYILFLDLLMVFVIAFSFWLSGIICGKTMVSFNIFEIIEICFRGLLEYICFSCLQVTMLLKFNEKDCFMLMLGFAVLLMLLSHTGLKLLLLLPMKMEGAVLWSNILIGSVYLFITFRICVKAYGRRKEKCI